MTTEVQQIIADYRREAAQALALDTGKYGDEGHYVTLHSGEVIFIVEGGGFVPHHLQGDSGHSFSREAIVKKLIQHHEEMEGGHTAHADAQLADFVNPFKFKPIKGKLPEEVTSRLDEHSPERHLFELAKPGELAQGQDAIGKLGIDRYLDIARGMAEGNLAAAKRTAESSPDPNIQFLSRVHDNLPIESEQGHKAQATKLLSAAKSGRLPQRQVDAELKHQKALGAGMDEQKARATVTASLYKRAAEHESRAAKSKAAKVTAVPADKLQVGDEFSMHGHRFRVAKDAEGYRVLQGDVDYGNTPLDMVTHVPVDSGIVNRRAARSPREGKVQVPFSAPAVNAVRLVRISGGRTVEVPLALSGHLFDPKGDTSGSQGHLFGGGAAKSDDDGVWRTIHGAHVMIRDGKITKGPHGLEGMTVEEAHAHLSKKAGGGETSHQFIHPHEAGPIQVKAESTGGQVHTVTATQNGQPIAPDHPAAKEVVAKAVDLNKQLGMFAKDASGNPMEVGEKPGQQTMFGNNALPAKPAEIVTDKEAAKIAAKFDPKATPSMFGDDGKVSPEVAAAVQEAKDRAKAKLVDEIDAGHHQQDEPTPRESAAKETARMMDSDYAFARPSSVGNVGEDLANSARHKRNAWRGLADAESNGTAEAMVTRDNLLKNEPHNLLEHADKHPLTALAMHHAIKAFPAKPANSAKDRQQFHQAYQQFKAKAEQLAATEPNHEKAVRAMDDHVVQAIKSLRGQKGSGYMDMLTAPDKYNNTANLLVRTEKTLRGGSYKANSVAGKMKEFSGEMAKKYAPAGATNAAGMVDALNARLQATPAHVKSIIGGKSLPETFGHEKSGPAGDKFNPAEAYVGKAIRQGGRDLSAVTANPNTATRHLVDQFGMRGVQWGNSVSDEERQHHAGHVVGALTDLAEVTGLHPRDISLNGKIGLAIGARGHGTASAHYEPGNKVINLTRAKGVGTLAHEWGHALDHELGGGGISSDGEKSRGDYQSLQIAKDRFVKAKPGERAGYGGYKIDDKGKMVTEDMSKDPQWSAMEGVRQAMKSSGFHARAHSVARDYVKQGRMSDKKANNYWLANHEMFARSFEQHVQHKLHSAGRENTYLTGLSRGGGLWPTKEESAHMAPAFDAMLAAHRQNKYGSSEPIAFSRELAMEEIARALALSADPSQYKLFAKDDDAHWITFNHHHIKVGGTGRQLTFHDIRSPEVHQAIQDARASVTAADVEKVHQQMKDHFGPNNHVLEGRKRKAEIARASEEHLASQIKSDNEPIDFAMFDRPSTDTPEQPKGNSIYDVMARQNAANHAAAVAKSAADASRAQPARAKPAPSEPPPPGQPSNPKAMGLLQPVRAREANPFHDPYEMPDNLWSTTLASPKGDVTVRTEFNNVSGHYLHDATAWGGKSGRPSQNMSRTRSADVTLEEAARRHVAMVNKYNQKMLAKGYAVAVEGHRLPGTISVAERPSAGRTYTPHVHAFSPALVGPTGHKMIAYEWKHQVVGDAGGKQRRVSDWSGATANPVTGQDIVHQFHMESPTGQHSVVSLETGLRTMGYHTAADQKQVRKVAGWAQTLAELKSQREAVRDPKLANGIDHRIHHYETLLRDVGKARDYPDAPFSAGGYDGSEMAMASNISYCPRCLSYDVDRKPNVAGGRSLDRCKHCGHVWTCRPGQLTAQVFSPPPEERFDENGYNVDQSFPWEDKTVKPN